MRHADAEWQYVSIKFDDEFTVIGISVSIGSVGDAYDCQSVLAGSKIRLTLR